MASPELPKIIAKANRGETLTDEEEVSMFTLTLDLFVGAVVSSATNERQEIFYDMTTEIDYVVRIVEVNPGFVSYWHRHKSLFSRVSPSYVQAIETRIAELESK